VTPAHRLDLFANVGFLDGPDAVRSLMYGIGGSWGVFRSRAFVTGELVVRQGIEGASTTAVDVRLGVRLLLRDVVLQTGIGRGIGEVTGHGVLSAFASVGGKLRLHGIEPPQDEDSDGVLDEQDLCPEEREDQDGTLDDDGCADPDNDGDGIPDERDGAPNEAEDLDWDRDDDGVPDIEPEGTAPVAPQPPDADADGLPDADDACPAFAGSRMFSGCPDYDHDGIVDTHDVCPRQPGTSGAAGCPAQGPRLTRAEIVLAKPVTFGRGNAWVARGSLETLDQLAALLAAHPEVVTLRIDVHTDTGEPKWQRKRLSEERAQRLRELLVARGVDPKRLLAVGHGGEAPLVSPEKTSADRQKNERVELHFGERGQN
jgi:outer membrane protein OmpA-like peptidoglycan-associated protein